MGTQGEEGAAKDRLLASEYQYVVTAQKSTAVTHALTGNFVSKDELSLIVAKCTRLEIYQLGEEGLRPLLDVGIYGRIAIMELYRPQNEQKDLLFILTERYQFCVLAYDEETGEIVTRAGGDATDRVGRPADNGILGQVDPKCELIFLGIYSGVLKIIPMDTNTGQLREAFNIRLEETLVLDIKFLHGCAKPTIMVLYEDTRDSRHVKTYVISLREKELQQGPWAQANIEAGACMLIPVPAPYGGALIVGEQTITYHNGETYRSISMSSTIMKCYCQIDPNGNRYLLGDHLGNIYVLLLQFAGNRVTDMKLEWLGNTSLPSCLTYLDNAVTFVGSTFGDSYLVRLNAEKDIETDSFLTVLDTYTNLGPIVDFAVVDYEKQGQGQVITCSGAGKDGSLRIIRNGIGINELAIVDLPGTKGIWALLESEGSTYHNMLCITFVKETRFLLISGEELEMIEVPGFRSDVQTVYCGSVMGDQMLQVTGESARLVSREPKQLLVEWKPPAGVRVNVAACNGHQLVLGVGGGHVVYLEIGPASLKEVRTAAMPHEVACITLMPPLPGATTTDTCAVGLWTDISVRVLGLPNLTEITMESLGGEILPRSVLFARFETVDYLLCALGDGTLVHFSYQNGVLRDRKKLTLGTQPVELATFTSKNNTCVFASSDRPTVIYSSHDKLLYSNVNLKEVHYMCAFNSVAFPGSLALVTENSLTIGTIDEIQKLHIRTVPLGEMPRRLAYMENTNTFAVLTIKTTISADYDESESAYLRLLDDQSFDTLDTYPLEQNEDACSLISITFSGDNTCYYVVGTAYVLPSEDEPKKGRLLVFQVAEGNKLSLVAKKEVKGAVYSMCACNGKLVAGIAKKVNIYKWAAETEDASNGEKELIPECGLGVGIVTLFVKSRGDFILVGDLLRSVSLLMYSPVNGTLEQIGQDHEGKWMTAVEMLDDEIFIGAENTYNLFTIKKNTDATNEEDRERLEVCGGFHVGEFINAFRHGSLVMQVGEENASTVHPSIIFATVNGTLGVMASLSTSQYKFLLDVQNRLNEVIKGVGGIPHELWRTFKTERREKPAWHYIDGDLIEQYMDLPLNLKQKVCDGLKVQEADANGSGMQVERAVDVDELTKIVEDLSRIH